jgi:putative transposase
MQKTEILEPGYFYHIYNRGNNRENIFIQDSNYLYFLKLYYKHINNIADTYCYCLLKNHFHILIRVKDNIPESATRIVQPFSNFFNAYSKSINKTYHRTGRLFEERFERKRITNESYLRQVIVYIHLNPLKHNFTSDFSQYMHSSYNTILSDKQTNLKKDEVIRLFDDIDNFIYCHNERFIRYENIIKEIDSDDY